MRYHYKNEDWAKDAYKAHKFLVSRMGLENWVKRRLKIVEYFSKQMDIAYSESEILKGDMKKMFSPNAVYEDWIAWYMYLVECLFERPSSGDPLQGARVYPFFSRIGQNLDSILQIEGIDKRIDELLSENDNQPDSSLFEILVANLYKSQGWQVKFIPENSAFKTPDFSISKGEKLFEVECKRMQKVPDYSEQERILWQNRSRHLTALLKHINYSCFVDIEFKIPLEETEENILINHFTEYLQKFGVGKIGAIESDNLRLLVNPISIKKVNSILSKKDIKRNTPEMIHALIGEYQGGENYAFTTDFVQANTIGMEDGLDALNIYYAEISVAFVYKWTSTSEYSIDLKAKDVKRHINKAFNQLSSDKEGIIHVAYETLDGSFVERERFKKINSTIQNFDFKDKKVTAIYCHALQFLAEYEDYNWAETNTYFQKNLSPNLKNLLLFSSKTHYDNDPHWEQDIRNSKH